MHVELRHALYRLMVLGARVFSAREIVRVTSVAVHRTLDHPFVSLTLLGGATQV